MSALYADSVTRIRAEVKVDRYGNPDTERDWPNATRTTVSGVSVQPEYETENQGDRSTLISGWRLISRTGMNLDLLPTDRVELADGTVTEVSGEIGRWTFGGRTHHVEARLKRAVG